MAFRRHGVPTLVAPHGSLELVARRRSAWKKRLALAAFERSNLQSLGSDLQQILLSRDVIGQAKGILMERLKITPEDAFDLLRRSSQNLNVKLRDVARGLAETGEFRMTRSSGTADQQ